MPEACQSCAALQAQIAYLQGEIARLNYRIWMLTGDIGAAIAWINQEIEKPTVPRANTLPYLGEMLRNVLENASDTSRR